MRTSSTRRPTPTLLAVIVLAAALAAAISGCAGGAADPAASSPVPASAAAPEGQASAASSAPAGAPAPGPAVADTTFCALARQDGITNLNVYDGDSTTPEQEHQVLANIDGLTAAAPSSIHADFVRFDTFEHSLLAENGTPDPALEQTAGGTELRDSLQRISDYLGQRCDIHP